MKKYIADRQISRLSYVGSNESTKPLIEKTYQSFIKALSDVFTTHGFLLGERPSSCDFAIFGQLTQLAGFDPTPRKLTEQQAPRVAAWTQVLEDISGYNAEDKTWVDTKNLDYMQPLLNIVIGSYLPLLLANAKALAAQQKTFSVEIDGAMWQQNTFTYHAKCLRSLMTDYSALEQADTNRFLQLISSSHHPLLEQLST